MTYYVGDNIKLSVRVYDADDVLGDPATLTLTVTDPAGDDTAYTYAAGELTKTSTGLYYRQVAVDAAGWWQAVFAATTPTKSDVVQFYVNAAP